MQKGDLMARGDTMGNAEDNPTAPTARGPHYGVTVKEHIESLMRDTDATMQSVFSRLDHPKRLGMTEREALSRQLAGVIADLETIRIWLQSGAPR